ncbi:hypothetical protein DL240_15305 [Lujinxingia litoralis]|uniref:Uncharacterized protein n=1 Tax=Lujinxingia litoralis TaxID=2211119 RepID=A0A328C338_9DELT|nr:hypothetical protein [Lujinxingia litoralis]RAL20683.1 hypothetical protein DL240_15305 [Lujinxingia litoralis]
MKWTQMKWTHGLVMLAVVLASACGEDGGPRRTQDAGFDVGDPVEDVGGGEDADGGEDVDAGEDADGGEDVDAGEDADGGEDVDAGEDADAGDEDSEFLLGPEVGVSDGTFDTRLSAAFDGVVSQPPSESAWTAIYENLDKEPLLYKEFRCEMRLQGVEVHPPTDSFLLYDEVSFPQGGSGQAVLVGRKAASSFWYTLATRPFEAQGPVVFSPEELPTASDYVAYGVIFEADSPLVARVQVAEVRFWGYCASPEHEIAWHTTPWQCTGVVCEDTVNPGGTGERQVRCQRDTGDRAHPDFCEEEMPATTGQSCVLSCPYELVYVGARPFTYDNQSGWLHEGISSSRTGPLPGSVSQATTREEIEGKPCSVLAEDPLAYFVGLRCREETPEGEAQLYCAFRCE